MFGMHFWMGIRGTGLECYVWCLGCGICSFVFSFTANGMVFIEVHLEFLRYFPADLLPHIFPHMMNRLC